MDQTIDGEGSDVLEESAHDPDFEQEYIDLFEVQPLLLLFEV